MKSGSNGPLGILAAATFGVRLGAATLSEGATWADIAGVGLLAGMGFTVSLFIADLALPPLTQYARSGSLPHPFLPVRLDT